MDGIDWAASAMIAARTRLEIASNNLANVSSDGFSRIVARGILASDGVRIVAERCREHGALRRTGRDFDLAILGQGGFRVRDRSGKLETTRDGAFSRQRDGTLTDPSGRVLLGRAGALHVPIGARIDERGCVVAGGRCLDRIPLPAKSRIEAGFLEAPAVDAIREMVDVLCAERSFESAQKIVLAIDGVRQKATDDVARVK
jgi:flagellar basal body rod protein FlgG